MRTRVAAMMSQRSEALGLSASGEGFHSPVMRRGQRRKCLHLQRQKVQSVLVLLSVAWVMFHMCTFAILHSPLTTSRETSLPVSEKTVDSALGLKNVMHHPTHASLNISIVIPVMNEAECIVDLIHETAAVCQQVPGLDFEIVVVDDASTDDTWAALCRLSKEINNTRESGTQLTAKPTFVLKLLRHDQNEGQSAALVTGVEAASKPWIFTLDGDGQNPPSDLTFFLKRLSEEMPRNPKESHEIFLIGHRVHRQDSWIRKLANRASLHSRQWMLHDKTIDAGCGVKLFSRRAFLRLPRFDHMHRFLGFLFQTLGAHVVNIPVSHRPRESGVSKYTFSSRAWDTLEDLMAMRWLFARRHSWTMIDQSELFVAS